MRTTLPAGLPTVRGSCSSTVIPSLSSTQTGRGWRRFWEVPTVSTSTTLLQFRRTGNGSCTRRSGTLGAVTTSGRFSNVLPPATPPIPHSSDRLYTRAADLARRESEAMSRIVLLVVLLSAAIACGESPAISPEPTSTPPPPLVVQAADLLAAYELNKFQADAKFKFSENGGRWLRVTSYVTEIVHEDFTLAGGKPNLFDLVSESISCSYANDEVRLSPALLKGEWVTVTARGQGQGTFGGVELSDCLDISGQVRSEILALPTAEGSGNVVPPPTAEGSDNVTPTPTAEGSGNVAPPPTAEGSGNVTPPPTAEGSGNVAPPPTAEGPGNVTLPPTAEGSGNVAPPPTAEGPGNVTLPPTAEGSGNVALPPTPTPLDATWTGSGTTVVSFDAEEGLYLVDLRVSNNADWLFRRVCRWPFLRCPAGHEDSMGRAPSYRDRVGMAGAEDVQRGWHIRSTSGQAAYHRRGGR